MQPLEIILGIIVVAIIVAVVVFYRKNHPSEYDKEWADKFLDSLSDYMYNEILNILSQTDFSQFDNITEANKYILELIYGSIWNFTEMKLTEASDQGVMPKLVSKIVTRKYVEQFIDLVLEKMHFDEKLEKAFNNPKKFNVKSIIAQDKKLAIEFSDENEYFENGEVKVEDLPKVKESDEPSVNYDKDPIVKYKDNPDTYQEVKQVINPPSEEEDIPVSEDDDTIEIVDDSILTEEERAAGVHFDKNGRKRDKRGRFIK